MTHTTIRTKAVAEMIFVPPAAPLIIWTLRFFVNGSVFTAMTGVMLDIGLFPGRMKLDGDGGRPAQKQD